MKIVEEKDLKKDPKANFGMHYQQCSLSVMDNIAYPNITFYENGICNYYYEYFQAEKAGAGELILNSIDRESTYQGYDFELLKQVVSAVQIPVVVSGGASSNADFDTAKQAGASGMAAGSMFVYQRPHNAVLISYPSN